jgi:ornithine cyclodeaminase/alanine dehydrogenase-like protein (mu-crystallin family)
VLPRDDVTQSVRFSSVGPKDVGQSNITVFDSTSLAIQDLAVALAAMERVPDLDLPTIDL